MQEIIFLFQKPIIRFFSLIFAFIALSVSILFSQSNSQNKGEKKINAPIIFNSSKSISPNLTKQESTASKNEEKTIQLQEDVKIKDESKVKKQKEEVKKEKVKSKKKKLIIMPSSKAPDPEIYKNLDDQ